MIDLLKESTVFNEFTSQELTEFTKICQKESLKNGARIFETDTPAEYLYIVGQGAVELRFKVTHYLAPKEITLDRKFQGQAFGWSALTEPYIYTLSAQTMQDSELLKFKAKDLKKLCAENNHLGYVLMKNIAEIVGERFAAMQRMLINVIQQDLKNKVL